MGGIIYSLGLMFVLCIAINRAVFFYYTVRRKSCEARYKNDPEKLANEIEECDRHITESNQWWHKLTSL